MSKTPRTDKLRRKLEREKASWEACAVKMIELCRELETELSEANEKNKKLVDELVATKSLLKMLTK